MSEAPHQHHPFFGKDFSAKVRRNLLKKGIAILSLTSVPDENGSFLNAERAYFVSDNGTGRVLSYLQLDKLGSAA